METNLKTLKVVIIRACWAQGVADTQNKQRKVGDVVEMKFEDGKYLISARKANEYSEQALKEAKALAAEEEKKKVEAEKARVESAKARAAAIVGATR